MTLALTFLVIGAFNALAYALLAGQLQTWLRSARSRRWLNRAGGGCLLAAGAWLGLGARVTAALRAW